MASQTSIIANPVTILKQGGFTRSASVDAFDRLRTSEPSTIFDSKQVYDSRPLHFDEATVGAGTGAFTYQSAHAATDINFTAGGGALRLIRQTKRYFNYQPGKSFLTFVTFNLRGPVANATKSVGYFDDNNGLFFRLTSTALSVVRRTSTSGSPVDEVVNQNNWNIDSMDGTGPSGATLDTTKAQILVIDFEWLGVGAARIGFVIDGIVYYVHEFRHANNIEIVYMQTPNLPIRWELDAEASAASCQIDSICCSVMAEGGDQVTGVERSVDTGIAGKQTDNTLIPIIQVRLKSGYERSTVFATTIDLISTTNSNFRWALILNPTVTGGSAASWISVTNSGIEYDVTADGTVSGGTWLRSGYGTQSTDQTVQNLRTTLTLAADYAGTADILTLAVQNIAATTETYHAALAYLERL